MTELIRHNEYSQHKEVPAFNLKFDIVFRSVSDRLSRFDSESECGPWNSRLIDDFRSDSQFMNTVSELLRAVVGQHTKGLSIASDGLTLDSVMIHIGKSLELNFQMHFLDAPNGYSVAPARFSVTSHPSCPEDWLATLCCGLCEPDGDFWYPSAKQVSAIGIPDDYQWSYRLTRIYGPPTISAWLDRRRRERSMEE